MIIFVWHSGAVICYCRLKESSGVKCAGGLGHYSKTMPVRLIGEIELPEFEYEWLSVFYVSTHN